MFLGFNILLPILEGFSRNSQAVRQYGSTFKNSVLFDLGAAFFLNVTTHEIQKSYLAFVPAVEKP